MKIESYDKTVSSLLTMGYFEVPRFQRPYSWERPEVEDFWRDTIEDAEGDYFIGSVVLYSKDDGPYGIVDGQQRLTTITILLCAIRDALQDNGFKDQAQGLHQFIERRDINYKDRYVLRTQSSYPYFQTHIQQFPERNLEKLKVGAEEIKLRDAHDCLKDKVMSVVNSILNDHSLGAVKKRSALLKKLEHLRDQALHLKLIVVILQSEDDAYTIFETLNTRGRDLKVSDLVRTHVTRLLTQRNEHVDRSRERFEGVGELFEESEEDISINSFIHHFWLSKHDYTTEKNLYKEFRRKIKDKKQAADFLDEFVFDSGCYRTLYEPSYATWRQEEYCLKDSLEALNLFKVRQALPFVLAVLREYKSKRLSHKLAKRALGAVECFHFAFTAITSQRSSGGISFMYARHARDLRSAKTDEERRSTIGELVSKLRERVPTNDEFISSFRQVLCSERYTKRKSLVQYILNRFAIYFGGTSPDARRMTIEHLAPQSTKPGGLTHEQVAEIGNLVWVGHDLNGKLGSKPIVEKLKLLRRSNVWIDDYLSEQTEWDDARIRQRTDILATLAQTKVWSIS